MKRYLVLSAITVLLTVSSSWAQRRGGGRMAWYDSDPQPHKLEISAFGGYLWSARQDVAFNTGSGLVYGEVDINSGPNWGVEVDVNVRPGTQLALLYNRHDSKLNMKNSSRPGLIPNGDFADFATEFWHIGALQGIRRDNVMPYSGVTLGGTRFIPDGGGDAWKFSMIVQLGAKVYFSDRLALRVQGRLPFIFLDGGFGVFCGGGGCSGSVGGTGIVQADVSAGLILTL